MKKKLLLISIISILNIYLFSQSNNTIDIKDEIYDVLLTAEMKGLCEPLSTIKPYTELYVIEKIDQIINNLKNNEDDNEWKKNSNKLEITFLEDYKKRFIKDDGLSLKDMSYSISEQKDDLPVSLLVDFSSNGFFSGGFYSDSNLNSFGYEVWEDVNISGNLGNNISYRSTGYLDITKMNLTKLGTYDIGWWWYDDYGEKDSFIREEHFSDRYINTYRNYAVLPYSYKKQWDGSVYYLHGGVNSAGLTGWPFEPSLGFGMQGEIHGTFFENLLEVGIGRYNREWGAMDTGSSLVLNSNAHPFFGIDISAKPFKWLTFSTLTGFLEFPNQGFISSNNWYTSDGEGNMIDEVKDSYFFHNMFSMSKLDFDIKNIHWDFGSTVIVPNRFELGYSFPLVDRVVYQNSVGDYDNLALYSNLKFSYPGIGYVWGSVFLDEVNALKTNIFNNTRCMFAYQGGAKINIPWIPFGSFSMRYTKVEPYCYTHEALDPVSQQPYYSHYISESYVNNGDSLGYYLPPNADELLVKFNTKPLPSASLDIRYQLIRHGVDWGSGSNIYSGSSIYSELPAGKYGPGRNNLHKYFLRDGVYEWMNVFAIEAAYDFNKYGAPLKLYGTIGYVNNWFTTIGKATPSRTTSYEKFTSDEYKNTNGVILSIGIKAFAK